MTRIRPSTYVTWHVECINARVIYANCTHRTVLYTRTGGISHALYRVYALYRTAPEDVPLAILTQTGGLVVIVQAVYTRIKAG